jgi:hypothetical protein
MLIKLTLSRSQSPAAPRRRPARKQPTLSDATKYRQDVEAAWAVREYRRTMADRLASGRLDPAWEPSGARLGQLLS